MSDYKFISLEEEIALRVAIRQIYKHEGLIGVFTAMGEIGRSLEIFGEVAKELLDEEEKKNK